MNKVECIVDAIAHLNGSVLPDSDCYRLRNPLLIRSFARPGKHLIDDKGRRVFPSWLAGYKAACFDVDLKIRGQSRAGLKSDDAIVNLLGVYGLQSKLATDRVVNFLKRALQDDSITANTKLSYFLESSQSEQPNE